MIKQYQNLANIGIGVGLVISIGTRVVLYTMVSPTTTPAFLLGLQAISLVGSAVFIYGCVMYALAKGRNGWWGAFGLLSLIGLIVLVCLKDYAPNGYVESQRGFSPVMQDPTRPPYAGR